MLVRCHQLIRQNTGVQVGTSGSPPRVLSAQGGPGTVTLLLPGVWTAFPTSKNHIRAELTAWPTWPGTGRRGWGAGARGLGLSVHPPSHLLHSPRPEFQGQRESDKSLLFRVVHSARYCVDAFSH